MVIEELHKEIDKRWDSHLTETRRLLRVPSVSATGEGIQKTADMIEDMLKDLGAKTGQFIGLRTSHPLVHGRLDVGADQTCLLYGMYDVQPVGNLDEWEHPPFGATIVKRSPYGEILVNRGVYNSKGALAGMLLAIKTMVDKDAMPLNLHFMIEGEEELGGQSLPRYVFKNKQTLSKADAAFSFDYCQNSEGTPVICFGLKGCLYFDLICDAVNRGGPKEEIHSSDAVWVESPAMRLVQALSTLVDENQDPAVDGIWDEVDEPNEEDIELVKKLARRFSPEAYKRELGARRFKVKGSKEELLMKYLFEPSLNINGINAGFTDAGSKTVLPASAMAKIDIRLVPSMSVEGTRKRVLDHLRKRGFADIKMRKYEDYPWSKVSPNAEVSKACVEGIRYHGQDPEIWPLSAGSAPHYLFDQVLGVPWGSTGLGHGGKAHAPNEFAVVSGMKEFEKSVATIFWKYAEIAKTR
jgi:acetylornithine deacetylase/succinyl-diaminopimelate desuccinylase-like protein